MEEEFAGSPLRSKVETGWESCLLIDCVPLGCVRVASEGVQRLVREGIASLLFEWWMRRSRLLLWLLLLLLGDAFELLPLLEHPLLKASMHSTTMTWK